MQTTLKQVNIKYNKIYSRKQKLISSHYHKDLQEKHWKIDKLHQKNDSHTYIMRSCCMWQNAALPLVSRNLQMQLCNNLYEWCLSNLRCA